MSIVGSRKSGSDHGDLADRILDAAQRLVFRTGARKMSLSDVATLAGVSRPPIYRYFVAKENLIAALGKRERRRFSASMANAMCWPTRTTSALAEVESFRGWVSVVVCASPG